MEGNGSVITTRPATNQFQAMAENLNRVLLQGDLSGLQPAEKIQYYNKVCETVGLNPLTKPFEYISFQGKQILYAGKNCAEQLRKIHGISIKIVGREKIDDLFIVTVQATAIDGRVDESIGALVISGLKGLDLANAMMKTETKAKRRVTLSVCGLGMLDESEVADVETEVNIPAAPLPPPQVYKYNIAAVAPERKNDAVKILERAKATTEDEQGLYWTAPERVKALDKYLVSDQQEEGAGGAL